MSDPLTNDDVIAATKSTDPTTAALAHEVVRHRGLTLPLRLKTACVPTLADLPDYGPAGWSRYDDEHDGTVWYVRMPVELVTDAPAADVPEGGPGIRYQLTLDAVIADVVFSLTCERDHDDTKWEIDNIRVQSAERVVGISRLAWDFGAGVWVAAETQTMRTPVDRDEAERALFAWADRERKYLRHDPLALELRDAAVEIIEVDALHDAAVTL